MSKVHPFIMQIDALIAEHEKAIASLTIARGVIQQLTPSERDVKRAVGKMLLEKPAKAKMRTPGVKSEYKGFVADQILYAMDRLKGGPATSKAIWTAVIAETPQMPIKRIWNTLYILVKQGKVTKLGNEYALPATHTAEGLKT